MKTTSNFNLKLPDGTDIANITDLNENTTKIDTELKNAQNAAAAAQTKADSAFQSASDGKTAIVAALIAMGISAATSESFSSLAAKIKAIETGINTDDATAVAANILSGKTAYAKGVKLTGTIPSKAAATITPGTANQTITAGQYLSGAQTITGDADLVTGNIRAGVNLFGVTGKSSVVETSSGTAAAANILSGKIAFVNGSKITGTMPSKAAATITPGTSNQTIAAGQYLSGAQTIAGSANLTAGNIKKGVNIFGVTGTFAGFKQISVKIQKTTTEYVFVDDVERSDGEVITYIQDTTSNRQNISVRIKDDGSDYTSTDFDTNLHYGSGGNYYFNWNDPVPSNGYFLYFGYKSIMP